MDVSEAFDVLARSVGDEIQDFMGEPRIGVSEEAVLSAGRVLLLAYRPNALDGMDTGEQLRAIRAAIDDARAQFYTDAWHGKLSQVITAPGKRAELISYIEARTGRALPLEGRP